MRCPREPLPCTCPIPCDLDPGSDPEFRETPAPAPAGERSRYGESSPCWGVKDAFRIPENLKHAPLNLDRAMGAVRDMARMEKHMEVPLPKKPDGSSIGEIPPRRVPPRPLEHSFSDWRLSTPRKGLLLVFEGCDGAGKATQARILSDRLRGLGMRVLTQDFPAYGSDTGQLLRAHLRGEWSAKWHPEECLGYEHGPSYLRLAEAILRQALMTVNRYELAGTLRRTLDEGTSVVLDRFWASSLAYGEAEGLDPAWIWSISDSLPRPDAWILLDGDPAAFRRRNVRRAALDRNEEDIALQENVRRNYLRLFSPRGMSPIPGPVVAPALVLDACQTQDQVASEVFSGLREILGKRFPSGEAP